MNKINYSFFSLFCLGMMLLFQACKKEKTDFRSDNRVITENRANSTVRIVNLAGFNQVVANGDSLTSFIVRNPNSPDFYKYPGTSYFPVDGKLGKTWYIPQDLFNTSETVSLDFMLRVYQNLNGNEVKTTAKNDYSNPTDYYLMPTIFMNGQPEVVPVKRSVSAPSKADHFKIRIINLTGTIKNPGFNSSGRLEDLSGNVSLAYADGSLVATATSNISTAQRASEYIEVPYGTYQFKVLAADGRQMPASGGELSEYTLIDPPTSTLPTAIDKSTGLTYASIQTYQPGGIYTIVVAPQNFKYYINELGENAETYQNAFQVINDNSAAANNTYFRVQGANAFGNQNISFKIDGKTIGNQVGFGVSSDYNINIQGTHTVEAVDAAGKIIASASQQLRAAQNYTAWLYPDQAGQAKLLLVANDLSGSTYTSAQDDATYARNQYRFFFFKRFLNLSASNPYITFTLNNGQTSSGLGNNPNAGINLQPGQPLFEQPYISSAYSQLPFDLMAYRSKPNVVPGTWANDIEVIKNDAFIADKTLYQKNGRQLPVQESGIYTVALIGQSGTDVTPANKARMIIVKHNK